MKPLIYVSARSGGRPDKTTAEIAWNHFESTGKCACNSTLAAEIANRALERGWGVGFNINHPPAVSVFRITSLAGTGP